MSRAFPKLVSSVAPSPASIQMMQMGLLVSIDAQSRPWVALDGRVPVLARSTVPRPVGLDASPEQALPVLLFLEDADPDRPIIVGFVNDVLTTAKPLLDMETRPSGATLDGKQLKFEASEEVVLKCGKGSITLQANGRVVIKGTELVSRAEGSNKIRGASVNIN